MGQASAKPKDLTPKEFQSLRNPVANSLTSIINAGGLPQPAGPLNAPITGGETDALAQLQQLTSGLSPEMQAALGTLLSQATGVQNPFATAAGTTTGENSALSAIQSLGLGTSSLQDAGRAQLADTISGKFLNPASNPFLAATIDAATRPILDQFGRDTQALQSQFTQAGQFIQPRASSPFDVASAQLKGNVANAIGDVGTNISFANFENERQRQVAGAALAEALQTGDLERATSALTALGLPRQIADTALQRQSQAFETGQDRAASAATAIPAVERSQIENVLANLQAQALPRLISELGIERGLAAFQQQQQSLLAALGAAGQLAAPTVATQQKGTNPFLAALGKAAGTAIGGPVGGGIGGAIGGLFPEPA